jgi:type II secretory ATPase GspE/PulE/Tfp pilus assembly ATPase PilB-like protein
MCTDPEAVRSSRIVPQVFPRLSKFAYRVITQTESEETLAQLYGAEEGASIDELLADMGGPMEDGGDESGRESAAADNELVKFVNKVIVDAFNQKASDIHIEPLPGKAKTGIRFRIDGSLQPYIEVPSHFRQAMITRLKIMCDLDISEKQAAGRQDQVQESRPAGHRVAGGHRPLIGRRRRRGHADPGGRRADPAGEARPDASQQGAAGKDREQALRPGLRSDRVGQDPHAAFDPEVPQHAGHQDLDGRGPGGNHPERPAQVQINKKAGIVFALVMRAFLRADPDIIMVGESRDKETVSMGVEASLTGHLVFSTLHTNSAPESIVRLLDMGMDPFNFADALLGILAQRLAKKLCDCTQEYTPDAEEIKRFVSEYAEELRNTAAWKADYAGEAKKLYESCIRAYGHEGRLKFSKAVGCEKCNKTGYKGRLGLHELLVADDYLKRRIQERARVSELFAVAVETGKRTLKMDGMEKIMLGLTDLKQVRSVCIK